MDNKAHNSNGHGSPSPVSPETQATHSSSGSSSPEPESVSAKGTRGEGNTNRRDAPRNEAGTIYCDHEACAKDPPTFKRRCEWKKHVDKHDRPYLCHFPNCKQKGFTYSGGLSRHLREVHKHEVDPEKFFWCRYPNCTRSFQNGKERGFTRAENLKEHERRRHSRSDGTALPINPTPVVADAKGRPLLAPAISMSKAAASQPTATTHQRHPSTESLKLLPTPVPSIQPQSGWDSRQLPPMKRKREEDAKLPSIASFTSPPYTGSITSTTHSHSYAPITPASTLVPDTSSIASARSPRDTTYLAPASDNDDDDPYETIKRLKRELARKEENFQWAFEEVRKLQAEKQQWGTFSRDRGVVFGEGVVNGSGSRNGSQSGSQNRLANAFTPLVPNSRG